MGCEARNDHLLRAIATACRLAGANPALGRLTVITGRRLTYRELASVRRHAADLGVDVTMDSSGDLTIRGPAAGSGRPRPAHDGTDRWLPTVRRLTRTP